MLPRSIQTTHTTILTLIVWSVASKSINFMRFRDFRWLGDQMRSQLFSFFSWKINNFQLKLIVLKFVCSPDKFHHMPHHSDSYRMVWSLKSLNFMKFRDFRWFGGPVGSPRPHSQTQIFHIFSDFFHFFVEKSIIMS